MTWFVIFGLFIFLGVMFFLPVLKYFISPAYFEGLKVVPVVMMAELFFGIFFNLSLWYKITDRTIWGTWFSLMGLVVTLALNIAFVPAYGYMACAWGGILLLWLDDGGKLPCREGEAPGGLRHPPASFLFCRSHGLMGHIGTHRYRFRRD